MCALKDGQVVDGFVGAYPEHEVTRFVDTLLPSEAETELSRCWRRATSPACARPSSSSPGNEDVIVALGELLVARGDGDEALTLLERIPESERTRKVAAAAVSAPHRGSTITTPS